MREMETFSAEALPLAVIQDSLNRRYIRNFRFKKGPKSSQEEDNITEQILVAVKSFASTGAD